MLSTLKTTKGIGRLITTGLRFSNLKIMIPIQKLPYSSSKMSAPKIQLKIIPSSVPLNLSYNDRNIRKRRELSPTLSIYKPQITSVLSILLRISGCALTVYVWMIGMLGLFCADNVKDYFERNEEMNCSCTLLTLARLVFAFPFAYHIFHGTRHLIWYTGAFLTKPQIYTTGYVSIALTVLLTAILASIHDGDKKKDEGELVLLPDKKNKLKIKNQAFDKDQMKTTTLTELSMNVDGEAANESDDDDDDTCMAEIK